MRIIPVTLAIVGAWANGCSELKRFAPPVQYDAAAHISTDWLSQVVRFDNAVPDHLGTVLSGVVEGEKDSTWRWTHQRAMFRFWPVADARGFVEIDMTVAEATLAQTGPVTITVLVNSLRAGVERYERAGRHTLRYRLQLQGISLEEPLDVTLLVDPPWISPSDHVDLGVIIASVAMKFEKIASGHAGQ